MPLPSFLKKCASVSPRLRLEHFHFEILYLRTIETEKKHENEDTCLQRKRIVKQTTVSLSNKVIDTQKLV